MGEVSSLIAGELLSQAVDWGAAKISSRKKQGEIAELLDETATRAAMVRTSTDLSARFNDPHLVEELLAHRELIDIPRDEAIATFLGEGADEAAVKFVEEFWGKVDVIMSAADESLASRKALEYSEETHEGVGELLKIARENKSDHAAQIALLERVLPEMETGEIEVEALPDLAKKAPGSLAASFLLAYHGLCTGGRVDFGGLGGVRGRDALALGLASVALSAERPGDVERSLGLCSFDASQMAIAAQRVLGSPKCISERMEVELPGDAGAPFVGLVNFEHIYALSAYQSAAGVSTDDKIEWNPIAMEKRHLAALVGAVMVDDPGVGNLAAEAVKRYRPWFPETLRRRFREAFSMAMTRLDGDAVERAIESLPKELDNFAEDEKRRLALRACMDVDSASGILTWAEAKRNHALLFDAAAKMLVLDEGTRPRLVETFARCRSWAFPTVGALATYADVIDPGSSYETIRDYGRDLEDEGSFHLLAYTKLLQEDPSEANAHIERAIEIMKGISGATDLLNSGIWVPYLIDNGRKDEVKELVEGLLPLAPRDYAIALFRAVASCQGCEDLLDDLVLSTMGAEFQDPGTAEVIAVHLSANGSTELAGRVALAAFKKAPNDTLASIAARWMSESSLDMDDGIVAYAEQADTPQMNILAAGIAEDNGMPLKRNTLLARASFSGDEASSRALMLYATHNMGRPETTEKPQEIGPNTYAILAPTDGSPETFFFFSDAEAVRSEGAVGPAGAAFSTRSSTFVRVRGRRAGEVVNVDGKKLKVTELGIADDALVRKGFEKLAHYPETVVLTGSPEELLDKMAEIARSSSPALAAYKNGIKTDAGTLYLGIETGARVCAARNLEFTIEAIRNPDLPYRKHPYSRNSPVEPGRAFLLSYSALVVISQLNMPVDALSALLESCCVTKSTARRLEREARALADEPFTGAGRLGHDGERPVFYEYGDEAKRDARENSLAILDLVGRTRTVQPFLGVPDVTLERALSDNAAIDIQTAGSKGFVYVTEDIYEAQIVDLTGASTRCGVSAMLFRLELVEYALKNYLNHMASWGAEPILEIDLVDVVRGAVMDTLSEMGFDCALEDEEGDEESCREQDRGLEGPCGRRLDKPGAGAEGAGGVTS